MLFHGGSWKHGQPSRPPPDSRRGGPNLLLLVYGAAIVLVAVTASALLAITSGHIQASSLNAVVSRDRALVAPLRSGPRPGQRPGRIGVGRPPAELEAQLAALTATDAILRIALLDRDGRVVASDAAELRGTLLASSAPLDAALDGDPKAMLRDEKTSGEVPGPAIAPELDDRRIPADPR